MSLLVKICGITRPQDALAAAEAGASAIGLMFFDQSSRCVSFEQARAIAGVVPPYVAKVGVFVNPTAELVAGAIAAAGLNILQFHGEEPPEFCTQFGLMSVKAFRIRDASSLLELSRYGTDAWLLDSYVPGQAGGTGEKFNWDLAVQASRLGKPIFLAGGLTPENVAEAVRQVTPYGVDVSSGVEDSPGIKNAEKIAAFVKNAKAQIFHKQQ